MIHAIVLAAADDSRFDAPHRLWWLLAVAGLAGAYLWSQRRRRRAAIRFADADMLGSLGVPSGSWKRHVAAGLLLVGLAILTVGVAQPTSEIKVPKERATIVLAIDTSLSMMATDVAPSRLDAAKSAATAFVDDLPATINVALVSFDTGATLRVPPTDDHRKVVTAIDALKLNQGTAIGDAVALAVNTIADIPDDENGDRPPAMIVLLSDGETTVGRPTADGIPLANDAGIPVNTIAYGTAAGTVQADANGDGIPETVQVPVDEKALAGLAEGTGGSTFTAESAGELKKVYDELGRSIGFDIERTDVTWWFTAAGALTIGLGAIIALMWGDRLL